MGDLEPNGRVECYLSDEQALGVRHAEARRLELLQAIAGEAEALSSMFEGASVTLEGLESRVITPPSGAMEMDMFIPYALTLEME